MLEAKPTVPDTALLPDAAVRPARPRPAVGWFAARAAGSAAAAASSASASGGNDHLSGWPGDHGEPAVPGSAATASAATASSGADSGAWLLSQA
jgi:hypothetical protein